MKREVGAAFFFRRFVAVVSTAGVDANVGDGIIARARGRLAFCLSMLMGLRRFGPLLGRLTSSESPSNLDEGVLPNTLQPERDERRERGLG